MIPTVKVVPYGASTTGNPALPPRRVSLHRSSALRTPLTFVGVAKPPIGSEVDQVQNAHTTNPPNGNNYGNE